VLYIGEALHDEEIMSTLGKFKTGEGCLYFKRLDDVDRGVLWHLIAKAVTEARKRG
jgi:hypothetical protein